MWRRARRVLMLWACALAVSAHAQASDYAGYVGSIVQEPYSGTSTIVYILFSNGHYGTNSCNAPLFWVSIDTSTSNGQASLAIALSAKLTNAQIYVAGNSICTVTAPNGGTAEVLNVLYLD
jgi:hypothetical protein